IQARLCPEDGELVIKALQRIVDEDLPVQSVPAGTLPSARYADALVALALSGGGSGGDASSPAAERYQVVINVDADTLDHDAEGACHIEGGVGLAAETVRRICCDAPTLSVVRDGAGHIVGISERQPAIPRS